MAGYGLLPSAAPTVLEGVGGPWAVPGSGALPSAAGVPQGVAQAVRNGVGRLPSAAGTVRGRGKSFADDWFMAGFPLPKLQGYTYNRDAGLQRTEMYSGATRQRRRWVDGRRTATVSFEIPNSDLYALEQFLTNISYDWFGMSLVTGDNTTQIAEPHTVRVKEDPSFGDLYGEMITVNLEIEFSL